jgi:hypothetical protein
MDKHELIVRAAAQIAAGLMASAAYGRSPSDAIVKLAVKLARSIEEEARKEPEPAAPSQHPRA